MPPGRSPIKTGEHVGRDARLLRNDQPGAARTHKSSRWNPPVRHRQQRNNCDFDLKATAGPPRAPARRRACRLAAALQINLPGGHATNGALKIERAERRRDSRPSAPRPRCDSPTRYAGLSRARSITVRATNGLRRSVSPTSPVRDAARLSERPAACRLRGHLCANQPHLARHAKTRPAF